MLEEEEEVCNSKATKTSQLGPPLNADELAVFRAAVSLLHQPPQCPRCLLPDLRLPLHALILRRLHHHDHLSMR